MVLSAAVLRVAAAAHRRFTPLVSYTYLFASRPPHPPESGGKLAASRPRSFFRHCPGAGSPRGNNARCISPVIPEIGRKRKQM
jgi:hypothetical protein